jgi:hypothetical protein
MITGLQMTDHPGVAVHDSLAHGHAACLVGGPDVSEVIDVLTGLQARGEERVMETARWFRIDEAGVRVALAYHRQHREEIDAQIEQRRREAKVLRRRYEAEQALG